MTQKETDGRTEEKETVNIPIPTSQKLVKQQMSVESALSEMPVTRSV